MTSNDFVIPGTNRKSNKRNKNTLKSGAMHQNVEINEEYLDEIVQFVNI